VWLLSAIYFLNALVNYGVFLWLPKILRDASGFTGLTLSLVTAIPFMVSLRGMVLIGRHSDRTMERKWHAVACALLAAVGLTLATVFRGNLALVVLSFTLSELGQRSGLSVFWTLPPLFLGGTAAAAGIALINSIGNLGGWVGPWVVGLMRSSSGDYSAGLLALVAALILQAVLLASLRLPQRSVAAKEASRV
jgi:cyanate permease